MNKLDLMAGTVALEGCGQLLMQSLRYNKTVKKENNNRSYLLRSYGLGAVFEVEEMR